MNYLLKCTAVGLYGGILLSLLPAHRLPAAPRQSMALAATYGQTVQEKPAVSLKDALNELESRYQVTLAYKDVLVQNQTTGTNDWQQQPNVESALKSLLSPFELNFKKVGKNTYVIKAGTGSRQPDLDRIKGNNTESGRETTANPTNPARSNPLSALAPALTVSGRVSAGETGEGLPGVNVVLKGTTTGTTTDLDGNYRLTVADGSGTLIFSYIGYRSEEVPISNRTAIDVQLVADIKSLSEVVVIGYGEVKKRDLTGSVASVSQAEVKALPVGNIANALQGRAAGVDVIQGDGSPGSAPRVRIRGANSITGGNQPLYVIDGFPAVGGLELISPNDIESIEVLKDASATAIYGSRGANGVILVTTRRGRIEQPRVDFETYAGVNTITNRPQLLSAEEFITLANEAYTNAGLPPRYTKPLSEYGNTDWQKEVLQPGFQQNYQLTLSGGNERTRFSVSGNYFKENGIVRNTDFSRLNLRFNLDSRVAEKLNVGVSLLTGRTDQNSLPTGGDGGVDRGGVITTAMFAPPIMPVYDASGNYVFGYEDYLGQNPVSMVNELKSHQSAFRGIGNIYADYELLPGLKARVLLGTNVNFNRNNSYQPSNTFTGSAQGGIAYVGTSQNYNWLNENTLSYNRTFGLHALNAVVGYSRQRDKTEILNGSSSGYLTDAFAYHSLASGDVPGRPVSGANDWALESYLGRINYIFNDKYLITFTGRYDGSSKFGTNNKFSFFPSGSVAWRVSEEAFMQGLSWLNDLKIRTSYGLTGNQAIPSYGSLSSIAINPSFTYLFGGATFNGAGPATIGNPDLRWETTRQWNLGTDASMFSGRLNLTVDYYRKTTSDLLLRVNLPGHTGYASAIRNIGSIENRGVELSLNGDILTGAFRWNTGFNLTANRNRVLDLGETGTQYTGQGPFFAGINQYSIIREGEPLGAFFGYYFDGIYQNQEEIDAGAEPTKKPGDLRYRDLNGDGRVNADDRAIIGYALPDYIIGFNNTFRFKNFDLNLFFTGALGVDRFNMNRYGLESSNAAFNNSRAVLNRWTPENPSNDMPRMLRSGHQFQVSTREVEDASYLRLRNVSLGYTLPPALLENVKLHSLRLYVTGFNLLTFTRYSGFDPESGTLSDTAPGGDYGTYPRPKTLVFGVNLSL